MKDINIPEHEKEHAPFEKTFDRISSPFEVFFSSQSATGVMLLVATVIALYLANSQFYETYYSINDMKLAISLGDWQISHSLKHWMNDGLMVLFFFMLGMEIKREVMVGELRDIHHSGLVLLMALGGMVFPALTYTLFSSMSDESIAQGWGIPMATDTAFALGLLALLGSRAPKSAAVILSALAIVDDIGAVLVISIFYTENIDFLALWSAAGVLGGLFIFNLLGIRRPIFYLFGGILLWWFILHSGVHATTAGVLAALMVPTRPYAETRWFIRHMRRLLKTFEKLDEPNKSILEEQRQHQLTEKAQDIANKASTPLQHWTSRLDKPVSLTIMPLFAFLNAGVTIPPNFSEAFSSNILLGVSSGLVFGKAIGICFFAWLGIKLGWVKLPQSINFKHIIGVSFLAGIGFTMSLFIGSLAFSGEAEMLTQAKLGVLLGSLVAGLLGIAFFLMISNKDKSHGN